MRESQFNELNRLILIGASGRVGSMVRASWSIAPPPGITIVSQFRPTSYLPDDDDVLSWDPLSESAPARLSSANGRAAMIVLAGATPTSGAPLDRNKQIALGCLKAARSLGIGRVLVASSSAVYGPGRGRPIAENYVPVDVNAYGAFKLAMEAAVLEVADDIDVCCLRIGNVLGADALLLNSRDATVDNPLLLDRFEDGHGPTRSYIDPRTLGEVLVSLAMAKGHLPSALNVASPRPVSMQSIAEAAGIPWQWRPAPSSAHQAIVLDCSALQAIHRFEEDDSSPARMLARLYKVRSKI